jgi:hypothetical protein
MLELLGWSEHQNVNPVNSGGPGANMLALFDKPKKKDKDKKGKKKQKKKKKPLKFKVSPKVALILSKANFYDFNIFELQRVTNNDELHVIINFLFIDNDLFRRLDIDPERFAKFSKVI